MILQKIRYRITEDGDEVPSSCSELRVVELSGSVESALFPVFFHDWKIGVGGSV